MSYLRNAWYCAGWSPDIGAEPIGRRFLDEPVVLWRTASGEVTAIGDMCPHRFAPLHLGKKVNDTIQCPYHGLRFDASGACVHNPHGSGRIPAAARVDRFPIVERHGAAWIWMGDAERADPALIPDIEMFGEEGRDYPRITDHLHMNVNYKMMIDNLLDLSHATFVHPNTLTPEAARRELNFSHTATSTKVEYIMRDVATPIIHRAFFPFERGDYYSQMEWLMPGALRNRLTMTHVGESPDAGATNRTAHLITPETETTSHYFWAVTRNRVVDDKELDAKTKAMINHAFLNEDQPMMKACQDYMAGRDFFELQPIYLETDGAAARARRMLEAAIAQEQSAEGRGASRAAAAA